MFRISTLLCLLAVFSLSTVAFAQSTPAVYNDSNGGTWELYEGDDGNLHSGTYKRKDKNGRVTSQGTWASNAQGRVAYQGDRNSPKEDGTWYPNGDEYTYSGTDASGAAEKGTLTPG